MLTIVVFMSRIAASGGSNPVPAGICARSARTTPEKLCVLCVSALSAFYTKAPSADNLFPFFAPLR
jgi:hypothetical protein